MKRLLLLLALLALSLIVQAQVVFDFHPPAGRTFIGISIYTDDFSIRFMDDGRYMASSITYPQPHILQPLMDFWAYRQVQSYDVTFYRLAYHHFDLVWYFETTFGSYYLLRNGRVISLGWNGRIYYRDVYVHTYYAPIYFYSHPLCYNWNHYYHLYPRFHVRSYYDRHYHNLRRHHSVPKEYVHRKDPPRRSTVTAPAHRSTPTTQPARRSSSSTPSRTQAAPSRRSSRETTTSPGSSRRQSAPAVQDNNRSNSRQVAPSRSSSSRPSSSVNRSSSSRQSASGSNSRSSRSSSSRSSNSGSNNSQGQRR